MELKVIQKESTDRFNLYLTHAEFSCKCGFTDCTRTLYHPRTVENFFKARVRYGKPIIVTSAFRCQRHNETIGGRDSSFHRIGAAMDLYPAENTNAEVNVLSFYCRAFFDYVKIYELEDGTKFIHCHNKE